ncbi:hypothetical protein B0A48_16786 [Cryoendolithus antarcticus]|uniref:D-isomer specific 2-hydroxyacid dehydrogenase NAD-binding domain-containing protein n=1 Tax=Cryoendolithus antarcticus TaxID=1507870 RepID=A0A1V8SDI6_9PEZI|nr:hypothetical protein B0A48_16786 [Cryoendolithus antarcticus]
MGGGPAKEHLLIAAPQAIPEAIVSRLQSKFPDIDVTSIQVNSTSPKLVDVPASTFAKVTILVTFNVLPSDPSKDAKNLDWLHLFSAGSNHIQHHPLYTSSDVTITTSSGIHGPQIAEWAVMTALVQSHKYKQLYELQKEHRWGKTGAGDDYHNVRDWVGRRIGVLGYGSIGRQVGRVAKALGMEVIAYTATPKDTPEKRRDPGFIVPGTGDAEGEVPSKWYSGLDKESLHEFLRQDIDWLLVSVPLTKETTHFLGKKEFEILSQGGKKPTFVTNIARGAIIDQPALIEALKNGTLAGAALDVTDPEPLPEDSELWNLPNVIVTPHVSGVGQAYLERAFQVLEVNLERRQKGERLINVVRRERGY